jgi:putative oxidoreductase
MTTTTAVNALPRSLLPTTLRKDGALLLLRAAAAAPLFFHGTQKLFGWFGGDGIAGFAGYLAQLGVPFPTLSATLAATSEVGGAVLLLTGLGFWALPPVVFTMLVAAATSARNGFDVGHGGAEFPLVLTLVLAALALLGPGSFAVRLGRRAS